MSLTGSVVTGSEGHKWEVKNILGKGTCCTVYRVVEQDSKQQAALKLYKPGDRYTAACDREVSLVHLIEKSLTHKSPYFVTILDRFHYQGQSCLLQVLCESHIWHLVAKNQDEGLSLHLIQRLARDMFRGLSQLHCAGFIHGDIKPTNLLWCPDEGVLKLIDFSLSCHIEDKDIPQLQSPGYQSPEVIAWNSSGGQNKELHSSSSPGELTTSLDIWAAGCVMVEMYLGHKLAAMQQQNRQNGTLHVTSQSVLQHIIVQDKEDLATVQLFQDLIHRCLQENPKNRITAKDALNHDFFKSNIAPSYVDFLLLPTPVLRLINVLDDVDWSSQDDIKDVVEDVLEVCCQYGIVTSHVVPMEGPGKGKLYVCYRDSHSAMNGYEKMSRKTFNDRTVLLTFFPVNDFHESNYY